MCSEPEVMSDDPLPLAWRKESGDGRLQFGTLCAGWPLDLSVTPVQWFLFLAALRELGSLLTGALLKVLRQ